jgi:hypothetical protein
LTSKLLLLLKIIGDAAAYRTFGNQYVESSEHWKLKMPAQIAAGKHFDRLCNTFLELSKNAYIKRGEFLIAISNMLYQINHDMPAGLTKLKEEKVVGKREVRR